MSYGYEERTYSLSAAESPVSVRAEFITKTYIHLLGAVLGCVALTGLFMTVEPIRNGILSVMLAGGRLGIFAVMIGFMIVMWLCQKWAHESPRPGVQYAALSIAVVGYSFLFAPLLYFAERFAPGVSVTAGILTACIFAGLTAVVFMTRMDFSWLRPIFGIAFFAVLGMIIASFFVPITFGSWFFALMVLLACAYILYDTSNVLHHYPPHMYVGAALELFMSVAMLFWDLVRLLMALQSND
ncbi:MAG TPA: Bax inhibitor-1 family protein [Planctomycetia bacterium]|jgi:FtsH-binding integral membrane protein|nr:Bax inhibitor-1 family protein [Planctomycetia bacterium]